MIDIFLNNFRKNLQLSIAWNEFLIYNFPTIFFLPHMTDREYYLFKKYSKRGKKVVEFGSGGSTIYFLRKNKSVYSVENSHSFYQFLRTLKFVKNRINRQRLALNYVSTGETKNWGFPKDDRKKETWQNYYRSCWDSKAVINPDILFIDGRFRVMCALCAIPFINLKTIIIFHDFFNRVGYQVILDFYEVIDGIDTLAILKLKDNIDVNKLEDLKEKNKFNFY